MPVYEYRCQTCGSVFEARRDVIERDRPAACPDGHPDSSRLLPLVAAARSATSPSSLPAAPRAGGCGPNCACAN